MNKTVWAGLLGTTLLAGMPAARAQEAPASATAEAEGKDEIVVTARFRNESLQDVPIAVSVVSGDLAASRNLNTIQDLATIIPTVDFRNGQSNKDRTVFVRGIGTITTSPGVESSVSTVIDGVVLVRPGQATLDLLDLERLEVLRGPQGTLFGKNASAGVINLVTKRPSDTQTGTVEAGYYEGNEGRLKVGLAGPISDKIGYSLSGLYAKYRGNVRNLGTGNWVNGYERYGVRGKIVADPTEDVTITLAGDYLYNRDDTPQGVYSSTNRIAYPTNAVTPSPALAGLLAQEGIVASRDNKTVNTTFDSEVRDKNYGGSLTLEYRPGDYTLTSITAYREWKNHQRPDWDGRNTLAVGFPSGFDDGQVDFYQFSQELRLASPQGNLIDYVIGAYFLEANTDERYERTVTQLTGATQVTNNGVANYGIRAENYALFGEANLHATDALTFLAGGRLIYDKLRYFHRRTSDTAAGVPGIRPSYQSNGSTDRLDYSARLGVQYELVPQATAYFTFSRGYKGPAYNVYFNMQAFDTPPLDPETSTSYEVGLKGSAFDGRLTGAIAAYSTDYSGFQANFQDIFLGAPVTRLINAGDVSTKGIEADFSARPTDQLTLNFAVARTDAKVERFNCPASATSCVSIDGQPLPFAPDWKLSGGAALRVPISDALSVELQTDGSYKSATQYSLTQTPDTIEPGYGLWNASVALIGGDKWEVRALVKNILDRHYANYLGYGTTAGVVRFVPRDNDRYAGVNARIRF
jgi:iron complex outermembrane recepter protein